MSTARWYYDRLSLNSCADLPKSAWHWIEPATFPSPGIYMHVGFVESPSVVDGNNGAAGARVRWFKYRCGFVDAMSFCVYCAARVCVGVALCAWWSIRCAKVCWSCAGIRCAKACWACAWWSIRCGGVWAALVRLVTTSSQNPLIVLQYCVIKKSCNLTKKTN